MSHRLYFLTILPLLSLSALGAEIQFNRDIRPILSDNCFACHGFDGKAREADLRLDIPETALAPRSGGPAIVPGNPEKSLIWQRIISTDPDDVMPPADHFLKLNDGQKSLIYQWIKSGAAYEKHWSFTPITKPTPPDPQAHPIDSFIRTHLATKEIPPSPQADRRTLIRRLSFDLRGLPPTSTELNSFLADSSPQAWENLVDSFLADPAFGERFAWPWLDAARYADTNGFQHDAERTMWPWRDWVIDALNHNLPFDQFTLWQIAGDLLPNPTFEQKIATGFLRNHGINGEGGSIPEENRVNYVFDMAETVGTVWMGLTFNCCRCHDHKYDSISQKDYFALTAFFNQTPIDGSSKSPHTEPTLAVLSPEQESKLASLQNSRDQTNPDDQESRTQIQKEITDLRKASPRVMIMADQTKRRPTYILNGGSYDACGEEVEANTPAVLPPLKAGPTPNRLDLARWLISPDHPLTARVTVNRLWQEIFSHGLVAAPEDFGVQSPPPTFPLLLDWLAADFIESGWDYKNLIKTIVTSQTYQQSSIVDSLALERDPGNKLLARAPRHRLPSWMIRDQALALSSLLVPKVGGPPVKPWQPEGLWSEVSFGTIKYQPDTGESLRRRSLYTFWRRISAPPMIFDNAKRENCEVTRYLTNSPLHALATLNDPLYAETSLALAQQLLAKNPPSLPIAAFELITKRPPTPNETSILTSMHQNALTHFQNQPEAALELISSLPDPQKIPHPQPLAALTTLILNLLNTDEALSKE